MLKTRIIPILLIKGNSVVKSINFTEHRMVGDAISTVKVFSNRMADEMVIVDIEATAKRKINDKLIKRLAFSCSMPLAVGGGIQSLDDADLLFRSGADKIIINSGFYSNPNLISEIATKYGSQSVVFSLDVVKTNDCYFSVSNSGTKIQSVLAQQTAITAVKCGAGEIILNSVDRDGTMRGYDLDLVHMISQNLDVPVIAAGGCGDKKDCVSVVNAGAAAIAAGSIFYWIGESIITLKEHMNDNNIPVRMT